MTNPTLSPEALRRAAAQSNLGRKPTVKVVIEFCPETGECEIMAPNNPVLFYGILKVAEKTFDRMQVGPAPDGGKTQ